MKKQLLFAIAFLGAITFASAQSNTLTYSNSTGGDQIFSFGSANYVLSGTDFSQSAPHISYNTQISSTTTPSTVSESFAIKTDASNVNATLTFRYRKGAANLVEGVISVAGQSNFPFSLGDDSATDGDVSNVDRYFDYTITIPLSTTATAVTITLNKLSTNGASDTRIRFYSVKVNGSTLSTNSFDLKSFQLFPNPTADSFQISTDESIKSVTLTNVAGQLVKTFAPSENYNISDLNAGIYFATVTSDNGSQTVKIVKK